MSTVIAAVSAKAWTELTESGPSGLVSNNSTCAAYIRQAESSPSLGVDSGHPLTPGQSINVDLDGKPEKIYARLSTGATCSTGSVAFTGTAEQTVSPSLWFDGEPWIDNEPWIDGD